MDLAPEQWREALKKGDASAIQREMESIKSEMQRLAQMPDSAEKRAPQEQLAQRMKLRTVPQLDFRYDASVERGVNLVRLIDEAVGTPHKGPEGE